MQLNSINGGNDVIKEIIMLFKEIMFFFFLNVI